MFSNNRLLKIVLETLLMVVGFGIVINLMSSVIENIVKESPSEETFPNGYIYILVGVMLLLIVLRVRYERVFGEGKIAVKVKAKEDRENLLESLHKRYQTRLVKKMDTELSLKMELKLKFTKEGTTKSYIDEYFINKDRYKEKLAGEFDALFKRYTDELKRLLIIGEPGAGKTVLLLNFAQELISLAQQNPDYPIPIILNLSSWRDEKQTFETWLEQNLVHSAGQFGTSKEHAKELASSNNLLLLLDGLDEVPESDRNSCFNKLTSYLQKTYKQRLVAYPQVIICCRREEYKQMEADAPVQAVISIEPLTLTTIRNELRDMKGLTVINGSAADKLLKNINTHPHLSSILTTAFHLHLALKLAEQNFDFSQIQQQKDLVGIYVNQQLDSLSEKYKPAQSRKWLAWLADKLSTSHKGITFELTDMQPNWVKKPWLYRLLEAIIGGIGGGLVIGFIGGIIEEISFEFADEEFNYGLWFGDVVYQITGGTFESFIDDIIYDTFEYAFLVEGLITGIILGFVLGLLLWIFKEFVPSLRSNSIQTAEIRVFNINSFNRKASYKALRFWFIVCIYLGGVLGIAYLRYVFSFTEASEDALKQGGLIAMLIVWVLLWFVCTFMFSAFLLLIVGLPFVLIAGIYTIKRNPIVYVPYQRLYASFLFDFAQWSFIFILLVFVLGYIGSEEEEQIIDVEMIIFIISAGLWAAVFLSPLSKHFSLRLLLRTEGSIPLGLVKYLNTVAKKTGLMEKDGGQWRFRHQLIQDILREDHG